ncbi:hypothetical protein HFN76_35845 [Rhizobium laguerreae]|uniref:hypothetical protein n=1 Tax=Rhizobium laguerreae TaxID=1076926 RepID=UPI001C924EEF|nr:hypothetical protein [Rhizobium laguerreae]MBY3517415.1 hypothetical protein [Rhizobium laguerreae]
MSIVRGVDRQMAAAPDNTQHQRKKWKKWNEKLIEKDRHCGRAEFIAEISVHLGACNPCCDRYGIGIDHSGFGGWLRHRADQRVSRQPRRE